MRILVDLSALGEPGIFRASQNGVFRVTHELLLELQHEKGFELGFTSLGGGKGLLGIAMYLKQWPELAQIPLFCPDVEGAIREEREADASWVAGADLLLIPTPHYPIPSWLRELPIKLVHIVHDILPLSHPEWVHHEFTVQFQAVRQSWDKRDLFICPTEAVRQELLGLIGEAQVELCPWAAREGFNEKKAWLEKLPKVPYFLHVGRWEPRKNVDFMVEAFESWCEEKQVEDINLVLVGSASKSMPVGHYLRSLFENPKWKARIFCLDHVDDEELVALYQHAKAFIFPSIEEGFGLPILEAQTAGCPVLSSNCQALMEVAGDAALFFDPEKLETLIALLDRVYREEALCEQLKEKGFLRAKAFSWQHSKECLVASLRQFFSGPKAKV